MEEFEAVGKAMIKPEQIPDDVITAFNKKWSDPCANIRQAIAAAINAWPDRSTGVMHWGQEYVSLMLPQEKNDD